MTTYDWKPFIEEFKALIDDTVVLLAVFGPVIAYGGSMASHQEQFVAITKVWSRWTDHRESFNG